MLGKTEGRRRRGQQRMRWLDRITDSMDVSLSKFQEKRQVSLVCCSPRDCKEKDMSEQLSNNNKMNDLLASLLLKRHIIWVP